MIRFTVILALLTVAASQLESVEEEKNSLGEKCGVTSCGKGTHCCLSDPKFCCPTNTTCLERSWGMACVPNKNYFPAIPAISGDSFEEPKRHG